MVGHQADRTALGSDWTPHLSLEWGPGKQLFTKLKGKINSGPHAYDGQKVQHSVVHMKHV